MRTKNIPNELLKSVFENKMHFWELNMVFPSAPLGAVVQVDS